MLYDIFIIMKWFAIALIIIFLFGQFIGWRAEHGSTYENEPDWRNETDNIEGATVTTIDNHTVVIEAKGRKFLITQDHNGKKYSQEIDVGDSKKVYASNDKELGSYIKRKINSGRK